MKTLKFCLALISFWTLCVIPFNQLLSQYKIEGYIFESGNRGFIDDATISLLDLSTNQFVSTAISNAQGKYEIFVENSGIYSLSIIKEPYFDRSEKVSIGSSDNEVIYLKHEIERSPGYIFDITLAEKDPAPDTPRDALMGAKIEVYNNTQKKEVMVIESLQRPDFKVDLIKGNHYTILLRKQGFLSKRLEAFVDVEGCILCFEGIGRVQPGVSDNLTNENRTGTLLANVEMDRYFEGKVIGLNNIYYDFNRSDITKKAADELLKVAVFLRDNPNLKIELGSHTDSRGKRKDNLKLSEKRAKEAVDFLIAKGGISGDIIEYKGYGESQLVNKCGDGVNCDESEHALNRRTELKILDFIDISLERSLRQMKTEELMDEILSELGNSTQIKVNNSEDLKEAIRAIEDEPLISKNRRFENIDSSPNKNKGTSSARSEEKSLDTKITNASANYTGYRIVIHFSRFELPKDHKLFKNHKEIVDYKTADQNHLFMIGDFESKSEAQQTLFTVKKKYTNAYIVGFEKGIRTY